ncbi:TlpA family protein disulfide reductase [Methylomonas methanica]|uniref:Redoxin domain protein n=1 Tax=Methylomonas methanica (strain DSM 25384 / MC09) TaxID=857087 RepID=F9ZZT7_METMM|nr:TlpA disulfide reductase family protein [Methylomonas methanica]AEF99905.1 Redoxin domain protein [Methylomonas methanica MC09]
MTLNRSIGILALICLPAAGIWFWQNPTVRQAPQLSFKTIKGERIDLADLKGKLVLVTFWATDCPGCIEEIPHLVELHRQYSNAGLTIIAVAMYYDPPNRVMAMAKAKQLPYAVALDPSGSLAQGFGNVQLTPTTFLIDRTGRIVLQNTGAFELQDIRQRLNQL